MSTQSRHSVRTVRTNRSANALARGARTGVKITSAPSLRNTSSKLPVNLESRSRIRNRTGCFASALRGEVAPLLSHPGAAWRGGDAGKVDTPSLEFDEEQDVDRLEPQRFDGEE